MKLISWNAPTLENNVVRFIVYSVQNSAVTFAVGSINP